MPAILALHIWQQLMNLVSTINLVVLILINLIVIFPSLVPGDPPSNFRGTVVNSTAVSLTWSEPLLPYGIITSYTITYNSTERQISVTVNSRDTNSYLISGLNEFAMYSVFIRASTRVGFGPSVSVTVTTNPSCKID